MPYRPLLLSLVPSHLRVQVLIHSPDGALLQRFRPYEHALGVKCFVWSPKAHLLALGSARDLRVRLLNALKVGVYFGTRDGP